MVTVIKDQKDLDAFIEEYSDCAPETCYMLQDRESGECFGIMGCTYASEAFKWVNYQFQLVISDDDYYKEQIEVQSNSKYPNLNPFYLKEEDK